LSIAAVALALTWDVWAGQPLSVLVGVVALPVSLLALFAAWFRKNDVGTRRGIYRAAVFVFAVAASSGLFALNRDLAYKRADVVIAAVEKFRSEEGTFPSSLDALVPRYLEKVPAAAPLRGSFREFDYSLDENGSDAVLGWTDSPPFGRPYYRFVEKRWGYLD